MTRGLGLEAYGNPQARNRSGRAFSHRPNLCEHINVTGIRGSLRVTSAAAGFAGACPRWFHDDATIPSSVSDLRYSNENDRGGATGAFRANGAPRYPARYRTK